jgi:type IV secretory pathway TraG/TraD family ATPase VirD4
LNAKELAGLLGLPLNSAHLPGLPRITSRQLPPAIHMPHVGTVLATSNYPGMSNRPLALATSDRLRHTWLLGPTGTGKSTLLCNLIVQDVQAGRAVLVVDAKGDLITDVLNRVPQSRVDDVVLIDPSRTGFPVGFNVLDVGRDEDAQELAVDQLVHLMASLWHSSFGPRTADVLRMGLLTLISARAKGGLPYTLIELPELLLNQSFRRMVTAQRSIPATVRSFWLAYEAMSEGERAQVIGPSLNKLRSFTTRTSLRLLLGQSRGIRLSDIFTARWIVLVSLAPGKLGAETSALLGSLIVSSFWSATLQRIAVSEEQRHPVMVYLDEFQTVLRLPLDLADMLAQARGLGVGLILAHQYLGQLNDTIKTAVLGTARSQLVFQLQPEDAKAVSARFLPLMPDDLVGLGAYEVAIRPCVEGATLGPVTGRTLPLPPPTTDGAALIQASLNRYGRPRAEVEAQLAERIKDDGQRLGRDRAEDDPA